MIAANQKQDVNKNSCCNPCEPKDLVVNIYRQSLKKKLLHSVQAEGFKESKAAPNMFI